MNLEAYYFCHSTHPNRVLTPFIHRFFLAVLHQLGDFLFKEYTAEQLRQYMCFYDESKMDISLADTIAKLA